MRQGRKRIVGAVGVAVGLVLGLAACGTGSGSGDGDIVVAWQSGVVNTQGIAKSFFTEFDGRDVVYKDFKSGADVYRAMQSGSVDIGLIGNAPFTVAVTQDADFKALWVYDIGTTGEGLVVSRDSGVTDVSGLEGKTVATPFGSTADYMLRGALAEHDVDPTGVKIVNMDPPSISAAWERGDLDAAYIWVPVLSEALADDGELLVADEDLIDAGYVAGDLGVVSQDLLDDNPGLVHAWMSANEKAATMVKRDPERAIGIASKAYGVSEGRIKDSYAGLRLPTAQEQLDKKYLTLIAGSMSDIASVLEKNELLGKPADADTYDAAIDTSFLKDLN